MRGFREKDVSEMKNKIISDQCWKNVTCTYVKVTFNSVFRTNASYLCVAEGGRVIGNGWKDCTFFGAHVSGLCLEADRYSECVFGNMYLKNNSIWNVKAEGCNYAGSCWEDTTVETCVFKNCNFRNVRFKNSHFKDNRFINCVFDGAVMEGCTVYDQEFEGYEVRCVD